MTQEIAMTSAAATASRIADMLNANVNDVEVNTTEDAYAELARRTNLDKNVIIDTLMGRNFLHTKDAHKAKSLSALFTQYFRGVVDPVYLETDLIDLNKLLNDEKEDATCFVQFTKKHKIKKGNFINKESFLYVEAKTPTKQRQMIIGSSRRDCAVYFVFLNDKSDVNNGVIYVRNAALGRLRRVNTFEVNPFAKGQGLVTDKETGAVDVKLQLTFNPNWLNATVDNMERFVFAPLVYVPPKMPKLKKQKGVTEVDMASLIEKTLTDTKIDPAKAAEKVSEAIENGIDSYATTALAKIAERNDGVTDPLRGNEPDNFTAADLEEGKRAGQAAAELKQASIEVQEKISLEKTPNETTVKAMEESRKIIDEGTARFSSPAKLFAELDKKPQTPGQTFDLSDAGKSIGYPSH